MEPPQLSLLALFVGLLLGGGIVGLVVGALRARDRSLAQTAVDLPEGTDPTRAEARFEHGVLQVEMPLGARRGPRRRIEIRTTAARDPGASESGPKVA